MNTNHLVKLQKVSDSNNSSGPTATTPSSSKKKIEKDCNSVFIRRHYSTVHTKTIVRTDNSRNLAALAVRRQFSHNSSPVLAQCNLLLQSRNSKKLQSRAARQTASACRMSGPKSPLPPLPFPPDRSVQPGWWFGQGPVEPKRPTQKWVARARPLWWLLAHQRNQVVPIGNRERR